MKFNVMSALKVVGSFTDKHSPEILTGLGIAGLWSSLYLGVKATPKALSLIEQEKDRCEYDREIYTVKNTLHVAWKCYVPAVTMAALSTGCIIGSTSINIRRNAALATAYTLSETALKEYQERVVERIGIDKEREVREAMRPETRQSIPNGVMIAGSNQIKCYDSESGQYFMSDIDTINRVINDLNRRMLTEMFIPINDLYWDLGINRTSGGDDAGWNIDDGFIEPIYGCHLDSNNHPCLVLDYRIKAKPQHHHA